MPEEPNKGLTRKWTCQVMRQQLDTLLKLCASWGVTVESLAPDAVPNVPIGLLVVAKPRPTGVRYEACRY